MTLLKLRAGRGFRVDETNKVECSPQQGYLEVDVQDGLCHLAWRNKSNDSLEDDLILFPQDSKFEKVDESSNRVYVLKFESSGALHFFYLQSNRNQYYKDQLPIYINKVIDEPENAQSIEKLPSESYIQNNNLSNNDNNDLMETD